MEDKVNDVSRWKTDINRYIKLLIQIIEVNKKRILKRYVNQFKSVYHPFKSKDLLTMISIRGLIAKINIKRLVYYLKIWLKMSKNSFLMILNQKIILLIFLFGKILRFLFFIVFLFFLVTGADNLAGYNSTQAIFFFLTFMVIDTTAQFLFREVYKFRTYIVSGDFDLILVKPVNSLFRVLLGGADVIDLITIPPLYFAVIYVGNMLSPNAFQVFIYLILILAGFIITTAFHIIVMSFGIITLEVDHTIMIYRDVTNMGRFPTDIYKEPLKSALTYFIPVAIMMSLPAKALMGYANFSAIITAIIVAFLFLFLSLKFWNFALKKYSSASS